MKTLYWDCFSGIAGNMAVASLIDAGACKDSLISGLKSIPFEEGEIELILEEKLVNGIRGTYFNTAEDHSHHSHNDSEAASHYHHGHAPHRGLSEIEKLIAAAKISDKAKEMARSCFRQLAEAEATIHGKSVETIHFHEVGARDSIADIVGVAICIDNLKVGRVQASPVHLGSGFVKCAHGTIPVPAPATALLLKNVPVIFDHDVTTELTTPTGAAILKGLSCSFLPVTNLQYKAVGHGHGSKILSRPNILRAFLSEEQPEKLDTDEVVCITTNVDNATGEITGHATEKLMQLGALDVCVIPVIMKKGRPALQIQVLTQPADCPKIETAIFQLLPTIGLRKSYLERKVLKRSDSSVKTQYGELKAKQIINVDQNVSQKIEFDEIVRISEQHGCTPMQILANIDNNKT